MIEMSGRKFVVLALGVLLAACGGGEKKADHTLRIARPADATSLDPAVTLQVGDMAILGLVYSRLTKLSRGNAPEGDLAQSWSTSPDGLAWTFKLRDGVLFDDGSKVTAAAVKFSLERIVAVGRGPSQGTFWLKSVEAPDPRTVRLHLTMPFPPLATLLAMPTASIVNPNVMAHAKGGDHAVGWLTDHTAGSGPYRVVRWDRDQRIVLEANPHAPGPRYFDKVVFAVTPDAAARRVQLGRGDIDIGEAVAGTEAEAFRKLDGVRVVDLPAGNLLTYLTLNNMRAPFNDIRVRQAVAKAIDYDGLIHGILDNAAEALSGPIPKGVPGYDAALPAPRRDLEGAKALLRAAGHGDGLHIKLATGRISASVQAIQSNLRDAGIAVELEQLAPGAFDARRAGGDFDMLVDSWSVDFPDPWIVMNFLFSSATRGAGGNPGGYADSAVDNLLNRAQVEPDLAKRANLYREAQRRVVAAQPIVLLYSPRSAVAMRSDLAGFAFNAFQPSFYNVADMSRSGPP